MSTTLEDIGVVSLELARLRSEWAKANHEPESVRASIQSAIDMELLDKLEAMEKMVHAWLSANGCNETYNIEAPELREVRRRLGIK